MVWCHAVAICICEHIGAIGAPMKTSTPPMMSAEARRALIHKPLEPVRWRLCDSLTAYSRGNAMLSLSPFAPFLILALFWQYLPDIARAFTLLF